jgi:hypothetical protein
VLRIFVFGLLLANILLLFLHALQPDSVQRAEPVVVHSEPLDLPRIELVDEAVERDPESFWQPEPPPEQMPEQSQDELPEPAPGRESDPVSDPAANLQELAAIPSPPAACYRLGPFESESEMSSLRPELNLQFEQVLVRESETMVNRGYWVFLPPYDTREQAERELERLTAAGVEDNYLMPNGAMANAISLGLFDQEERAVTRQQKLMALGLGLEIRVELQASPTTQYWLEAGPANDSGQDLSQWTLGHPGTQLTQLPCTMLVAESRSLESDSNSEAEFAPATGSLPN